MTKVALHGVPHATKRGGGARCVAGRLSRIVPRSVTEATIPVVRSETITCAILRSTQAMTCRFVIIDTRSTREIGLCDVGQSNTLRNRDGHLGCIDRHMFLR